MEERRKFKRIIVDDEANIYIENIEYPGMVQNISESGIGIVIPKTLPIINGQELKFQYIDRRVAKQHVVISGEGVVNRVEYTDDGSTILGCDIVSSKKIRSYVSIRRVVDAVINS